MPAIIVFYSPLLIFNNGKIQLQKLWTCEKKNIKVRQIVTLLKYVRVKSYPNHIYLRIGSCLGRGGV